MEINSVTLTRKDLYELVWSNSMITLAKRFAISDNGLRSICERMNIPLPVNGHWMKLQFNKKVNIIPLPEDADVDQMVELSLRKEAEEPGSIDPLKTLAREIKIIVTERLAPPDELIVQAKKILTAKDKHIHNGTLRTYRDALDIHVSPAGLSRALLVMDIFIKILQARGHGIIFKNDETFAQVKGQDLQVKLREQTKRVKGENSWADYVPTGIFYFKIDRYPDREFKDGSVNLEDKMAEILTWMEGQADKDNARDEEWRLEREAKELAQERLQQIDLEREKETQRYRDLVSEAERWKQAVVIREYIEARASVADPGWIEWAKNKADWMDPLIMADDKVLGRYGEDAAEE